MIVASNKHGYVDIEIYREPDYFADRVSIMVSNGKDEALYCVCNPKPSLKIDEFIALFRKIINNAPD